MNGDEFILKYFKKMMYEVTYDVVLPIKNGRTKKKEK